MGFDFVCLQKTCGWFGLVCCKKVVHQAINLSSTSSIK